MYLARIPGIGAGAEEPDYSGLRYSISSQLPRPACEMARSTTFPAINEALEVLGHEPESDGTLPGYVLASASLHYVLLAR